MNKLPTRKTVTLFLTLIFGIMAVAAFIMNKDIPASFGTIIATVIGYYFGKSTALDVPKVVETEYRNDNNQLN
jgi:hypothetical protein